MTDNGAFEVLDSFRVKEYICHRLQFHLPLVYRQGKLANINTNTIAVVCQVIQKYNDSDSFAISDKAKLVCYLQGGPGGSCATFNGGGYTKTLVEKGYTVVLMDQRGTGWLTPIETRTLLKLAGDKPADQLEYLLNFRADLIVEDAERIRKALIGNDPWTILGQLYGGFCLFTYISKYPKSLTALLITGGVPPVGFTATDVYTATYARTNERNIHYYRKYPEDEARVQAICKYLAENEVTVPNGGRLSVERFQQLGIRFGASGGTDAVHQIVTKFAHDLQQLGEPTYNVLLAIQNLVSFDALVIYALFQENIYSDGPGSHQAPQWAAHKLRPALFVYSEGQRVNFTGEMVYPFMYDDYAELRPLKQVAELLMSYDQYSQLYDVDVLRTTDVPIVAATYVYDQYVDFDLTRQVKENVFQGNGNLKQYITLEFFHNGIGANPDKVVGTLLQLLKGGEVD